MFQQDIHSAYRDVHRFSGISRDSVATATHLGRCKFSAQRASEKNNDNRSVFGEDMTLNESSTSSVYVPMPTTKLSAPDSPVSGVVFCQRLRSASSHQQCTSRYRLSTYGRWAFSVAGPTVWNSLPEDLRDPEYFAVSYRQSLKTFLFSQY